jgi:hypothetical protein
MHPPRYSSNKQRLYCSHFCDVGNKQCPSDDYKYTDIHSNFLCSNNFFNLYYKCFNKDELLNYENYSGILFSKFLGTPSIFIDLEKEYKEFAIDFWYFPEDRFRHTRYPDPDDKEYDPYSHEKPPSEKNRYIFLSDCCKVVFGSDGRYNNMIVFFSGNSIYTRNAENNIDLYNWNHFVLTYFYSLESSGYTYYLTLRNSQFYYVGGYNGIKINYKNWNVPANNIVLSQIMFCNFDENLKVGKQKLRDECKKAEWLDGFYRRMQIFDIRYSSKNPVFYAHHFEDDGVNGMLKHRYIFGLNSVVDNHLIDLIEGKNGFVPWLYDTMANQNPDKHNYIIYQSNFSPEASISGWGASNYVSSYSYIGPEIKISKGINNKPKCLIVQRNGNCIACKKGYSLFSSECKGDENADSNTAKYYYKNPGKNMPERLSLNLDFEKIKNTPYFTMFFFIKIYGFVKDTPSNNNGFVKILIFHEERDSKEEFYLAWTPSQEENQKEALYFCYNDKKLFSYQFYREQNFGQWVLISFAAFRENDLYYQLNMAQASILFQNLKMNSVYEDDF